MPHPETVPHTAGRRSLVPRWCSLLSQPACGTNLISLLYASRCQLRRIDFRAQNVMVGIGQERRPSRLHQCPSQPAIFTAAAQETLGKLMSQPVVPMDATCLSSLATAVDQQQWNHFSAIAEAVVHRLHMLNFCPSALELASLPSDSLACTAGLFSPRSLTSRCQSTTSWHDVSCERPCLGHKRRCSSRVDTGQQEPTNLVFIFE